MIKIAGLTAVLALLAAPVAAQDFSQSPSFGTVNLSSGFTPDPRTVDLVAGGTIDLSGRIGNCVGKIASAPDVRLQYSAGNGLPLVLSTRSNADTTLLVNTPDGRWFCDDDGAGALNAKVVFSNPSSGQYDIWIGTFGESPESASLLISEIR
jgi:hypothetical protein